MPTAVRHLLLLAVAAAIWGCGDGGSAQPAPEGQLELASGLRVEATLSAARSPEGTEPTLWLATPKATLTVETGTQNPNLQTVRLANVPPSATVEFEGASYLSGEDRDGCGESGPTGSVNCATSDDAICSTLSSTVSGSAPTVLELKLDPPACARLEYRLKWVLDRSRPYRIAVVGPSDEVDRLGETIDAAAERNELVLLTGDHAPTSTSEGLRTLADAVDDRDTPVVVTPGEREYTSEELGSFEQLFGSGTLRWDLGGIQFLGVASPQQQLESQTINSLESRLANLDLDQPIVVFTHTPPIDPRELRDRGFRSRIEGARTLSTLATYRTDLLVSGHLPERLRRTYEGVEMVVPPALGEGGYLSLKLTPRTAGADSKLDVTVEAVK